MPEAEYFTVSQTAALLGLKERTVQKRCAAGKLTAQLVSTPDGDRWQIDPANFDANEPPERERMDANGREQADAPELKANSKAPEQAANDGEQVTRTDANVRALIAEKDARIEDLRGQIDAWRLQAEAANRTAAETSAALREALKAMPKQLTAGNRNEPIEAAQGAQSTQVKETSATVKQSPQNGTQRKTLTAWQRVAARVLGIR